jgi:hypothetical protein
MRTRRSAAFVAPPREGCIPPLGTRQASRKRLKGRGEGRRRPAPDRPTTPSLGRPYSSPNFQQHVVTAGATLLGHHPPHCPSKNSQSRGLSRQFHSSSSSAPNPPNVTPVAQMVRPAMTMGAIHARKRRLISLAPFGLDNWPGYLLTASGDRKGSPGGPSPGFRSGRKNAHLLSWLLPLVCTVTFAIRRAAEAASRPCLSPATRGFACPLQRADSFPPMRPRAICSGSVRHRLALPTPEQNPHRIDRPAELPPVPIPHPHPMGTRESAAISLPSGSATSLRDPNG